jgi:hypothetical protein
LATYASKHSFDVLAVLLLLFSMFKTMFKELLVLGVGDRVTIRANTA